MEIFRLKKAFHCKVSKTAAVFPLAEMTGLVHLAYRTLPAQKIRRRIRIFRARVIGVISLGRL